MVIQFCNVNDTQAIAQAPPTQLTWPNQTLLNPGMYCQNLDCPYNCCSAPFHMGFVSFMGEGYFFTAESAFKNRTDFQRA